MLAFIERDVKRRGACVKRILTRRFFRNSISGFTFANGGAFYGENVSLAREIEKEYNRVSRIIREFSKTREKPLPTNETKMAFSTSITVDASDARRNKIPCDAFPNSPKLTPFFADLDAFEAFEEETKRDVRASFFSTFERRFEEACARLFSLNAPCVSFSRFEFARKTPLEERAALLQSADARFLFVAPRETFLLFLCASLGFDVERICQDEIIWRDLTSERGGNFTELERATLNFASSRLAALFPSDFENEETNWRGEFLERPTREALETYGAEPCYWEERILEIGAKRFPFRLCFPFSNFLGKNARFPVELDAIRDESERVEVEVEIARGVVDARRWENLKPGDVLMTDVPADALFTVLLDGKPTFRARPGVFRGVTSVQLKERIDE